MKKIAVYLTIVFLACSAVSAAGPRNVLAHSSGEWTWCAQVTPAGGPTTGDPTAAIEQTAIFARQDSPGQKWRALPKLGGRAIALAGRSSQLAVLMSKGDWFTLWADGSATGEPLPAEGRLITFADDGKDLWALGSVKGGIDAANLYLARQRTAQQPATSHLREAMPEAVVNAVHSPRSLPAKLVVFHEQNGRWTTVAELPADSILPSMAEVAKAFGDAPTTDPSDAPLKMVASESPLLAGSDIAMTIIGGTPVVAVKTANDAVRIMSYVSAREWKEGGWPTPSRNQSVEAFDVLSDGIKPVLWWSSGTGPGELFADPLDNAGPAKLKWVSPDAFDGLPAAAFSGGYFCLFGPHGGTILEQRYKPSGEAIEAAEPIGLPVSHEILLPIWLEAVFLASMGFSVGASMHRQWALQSKPAETAEHLSPAFLLPRLTAGLIDLLPVIGASTYLYTQIGRSGDSLDFPSTRSLIIFLTSFAFYILHTTLVESLTHRSIGKWIMRLKVVTVTGERPTRSQLVIRNLLRIVDPLIMIILSPLHQRSADSVAGTMVVRGDEAVSPKNTNGSEPDKSDSH